MLRPMIRERIQRRANDYPIKAMTPVAEEILRNRNLLFHGVSTLLKAFPILACKYVVSYRHLVVFQIEFDGRLICFLVSVSRILVIANLNSK